MSTRSAAMAAKMRQVNEQHWKAAQFRASTFPIETVEQYLSRGGVIGHCTTMTVLASCFFMNEFARGSFR